jgi:hypothetical protein
MRTDFDEAQANGIIMFGWTTAIVIAAVQRIYFSEASLQ